MTPSPFTLPPISCSDFEPKQTNSICDPLNGTYFKRDPRYKRKDRLFSDSAGAMADRFVPKNRALSWLSYCPLLQILAVSKNGFMLCPLGIWCPVSKLCCAVGEQGLRSLCVPLGPTRSFLPLALCCSRKGHICVSTSFLNLSVRA